jgi:hypothetical protein
LSADQPPPRLVVARQLAPIATRLALQIRRDYDESAKVHRHADEFRQQQATAGSWSSLGRSMHCSKRSHKRA